MVFSAKRWDNRSEDLILTLVMVLKWWDFIWNLGSNMPPDCSGCKVRGLHPHYTTHTGPSEAGGGWGGLQPPNILLKFADFVSEKGCKSQGRMKEDSNLYIFKEATRMDQKCNIF